VFRHSQDKPLYGIAKVMGAQEPEFCVYEGRRRVRRGSTLSDVLDLFERRLRLVRD
jgi:hypothetical protein